MAEFKPKRLITHKELDKAVDVRQLRNGHTGIPIYNLVIYVYYNKGTKPLETGYSGYTQVRNADEMPEELQNRNIIWGINLGKWVENILSKGVLPRKPNNVTKEDWVQAVWDGNIEVLGVPKLALTQAQKKEVKNVLYKYINRNGTIALHEEEEQLKNGLDDEKERKLLEDTIKDILMDIEGNIYSRLNLDSVESHHALDFNIFIDALTLEELRDVEQGARDYINNPGM